LDSIKKETVEEIGQAIKRVIKGEVRTDLVSRHLYSTDASIYHIEPVGVVLPKTTDELGAVVEILAASKSPVIARGSGSGLAGQAIGSGWVIDCSRWLDRLVEVDPEEQTAIVEPGLVLNAFNRELKKFGLQFGPDPASAERASLGGSLGNNAAGAHSICYGMFVDHILEVETILSDGSPAIFGETSIQYAQLKAQQASREGEIYRAALQIRENMAGEIKAHWPRTWRRASGYNLNYLLPWAPSGPTQWSLTQKDLPYPPVNEASINLAQLFAGAEGTLGLVRRMKLRLLRGPEQTVLLVLKYSNIVEACEAVPGVLEHNPSAVELIPHNLIQLAASIPAYASLVSVLKPLFENGKAPAAVLAVEFSGNHAGQLRKKALKLARQGACILAEEPEQQQKIWDIRKAGLGLFMSRAGDAKPWSFIEDLSVPVENLGRFVREMYRILDEYGVEGENYGHASAGCLHIRPVLNLKTVRGVEMLRAIAHDAVELTLSLGGAVSGEHGDGLARSEWGEQMFGRQIMSAFRLLKQAADPDNLLNPGKIVSPNGQPVQAMDKNLRFGSNYHSKGWSPFFDFSRQAGLEGAIEQCNGAGVCRKHDGLMCPSFQATREENFSTRGRANLLRALITGGFSETSQAEEAVKETLDLCLACKGCKAECPSAVDMAKLKYEFLDHYYRSHPRQARDYLFGYIGKIASWSHPFRFIINPILGSSMFASLADKTLDISHERKLPTLARKPLRASWKQIKRDGIVRKVVQNREAKPVLFLTDPFTEYFNPQVGLAALQTLEMMGFQVTIIPVVGTGRTLISKGFLTAAKKQAEKMINAILRLDPDGECAIVGVEPSEVFSFGDEYLDLLGADDRRLWGIVRRVFMVEEYLIRKMAERLNNEPVRIATHIHRDSKESFAVPKTKPQVLLHGHCYQKARLPADDGYPVGAEASRLLLELVGYQVKVIDSGCCGMAGAFGYEKEHKDLSMDVGGLVLFPTIEAANQETLIAAAGVSCRTQIQDGTGRTAFHPIELFLQRS